MANISEESFSFIYNDIVKNILPEYVITYTESLEYHPWLFAFLGSLLVGLSGIFPLLIIPVDEKAAITKNIDSPSLKVLLSFAVGALLGDVFLHLLPEAWLYASLHRDNCDKEAAQGHVSLKCGLWVLCGLLLFIIVEKVFAEPPVSEDDVEEEEVTESSGLKEKGKEDKQKAGSSTTPVIPAGSLEIEDIHRLIEAEKIKREKLLGDHVKNGGAILCDDDDAPLYESCLFNNNADGTEGSCGLPSCGGNVENGVVRGRCLKGNRWIGRTIREKQQAKKENQKGDKKHVSGYLNLMANSIDNFTHGLAVGGSFLVSFRVGMLSTFAILVHEIPHEVGDFAILLRSGFTRWEAAKAQLATATTGLVGAMTAVIFSGATTTLEAKTSWILPFTAGGFLHIALITVLPDLLKEESPIESLKQLSALIAGIVIMGVLTAIVD